jgi:hypothetical protein
MGHTSMTTPQRRRKDSPQLSQASGIPATLLAVRGDTSTPVELTTVEPTHDEIAHRAYQLYEQRGGDPGRDWDDWFSAELDLRRGRVTAPDRLHVPRSD